MKYHHQNFGDGDILKKHEEDKNEPYVLFLN